MTHSSKSTTVLWAQVSSLAAVQGAIALSWVIYGLYLPQLLAQFGFPKAFATGLLVVESVLGIGMEPLMGGLSDRAQRWLGSKFPFVAVGVVLSSALFIAIPTIVIFGNPNSVLRWGLPIVLVAWALAMTIFRSPVLSLLGRYAFSSNLPQAASLLTLVGALAGATGTLANQFILSLGAAATFAIGSVVMLVAAAVLRSVNPQAAVAETVQPTDTRSRRWWLNLVWIFGTGAGVSLGFVLMRSLLSSASFQGGTSLVIFTIAHLLTIIPAGLVAVKLGNQSAMLLGAGTMAIALLALGLLSLAGLLPNLGAIGLVALLGAAFSLVANGTIPFALSLVPASKAGLGTGMYFGGGALAGSLFGSAQLGTLPGGMGAMVGAIAFLVAGLCIAASWKGKVL